MKNPPNSVRRNRVRHIPLIGNKITGQYNGTDTMYFRYDSSDNLVGFSLNGTDYIYIKNVQGDIIAIADTSGNVVVEYAYDAWGQVLATTGSAAATVGAKSPFLFKGYYYDIESGLYYLQNRYYNPSWGRFVNADTATYLSSYNTLAYNLFYYGNNNPCNHFDPDGHIALNTNAITSQSWVAKAVAKYIPNLTAEIARHVLFNTPKWLGIYIELSVNAGTQTNPSGMFGYGFSRNSFDVTLSIGSGQLSVAYGADISWTESYIIMSIVYSPKNTKLYEAINFKFAISHLMSLAVGLVCIIVPAVAPVAANIVRAFALSANAAKPIILALLPLLLGV